jgi:hypothetical protein
MSRLPSAPAFAAAETALKEGLAQYYTERVLRRLERRYARAPTTFLALLPNQPPAYRAHEPWVQNCSPEAVRRAMLEIRRWNEGTMAHLNQRLEAAQKELNPTR